MSPRVVRLHSENNHFQRADVLRRNRHRRQQYHEFFVEGVLPINRMLTHGWEVRSYFHSGESRLSDWATDILQTSRAETHFELPSRMMAKLSGKDEPSELIAVVPMREDRLDRIPITADLLVVVCDRPGSPGNLGSIIRSADALGARGVVVTGHAADIYDPETITSSRGSLFAVPVVRVDGPRELLAWFAQVRETCGDLQIVGSDERAEIDLWNHQFRLPTVLATGNETWGLSAAVREMCDTMVRIPMSGSATSLNLAAATSIALYEIARQRHA